MAIRPCRARHPRLEALGRRRGGPRRPVRCAGCGICESRCPVGEEAAIGLTSVGESRDPLNRMLLGG